MIVKKIVTFALMLIVPLVLTAPSVVRAGAPGTFSVNALANMALNPLELTTEFSWQPALDPEGDAVTYRLVFMDAADTLYSSASLIENTYMLTSDEISVGLTGREGRFVWLVIATDSHGESQISSNQGSIAIDFAAPRASRVLPMRDTIPVPAEAQELNFRCWEDANDGTGLDTLAVSLVAITGSESYTVEQLSVESVNEHEFTVMALDTTRRVFLPGSSVRYVLQVADRLGNFLTDTSHLYFMRFGFVAAEKELDEGDALSVPVYGDSSAYTLTVDLLADSLYILNAPHQIKHLLSAQSLAMRLEKTGEGMFTGIVDFFGAPGNENFWGMVRYRLKAVNKSLTNQTLYDTLTVRISPVNDVPLFQFMAHPDTVIASRDTLWLEGHVADADDPLSALQLHFDAEANLSVKLIDSTHLAILSADACRSLPLTINEESLRPRFVVHLSDSETQSPDSVYFNLAMLPVSAFELIWPVNGDSIRLNAQSVCRWSQASIVAGADCDYSKQYFVEYRESTGNGWRQYSVFSDTLMTLNTQMFQPGHSYEWRVFAEYNGNRIYAGHHRKSAMADLSRSFYIQLLNAPSFDSRQIDTVLFTSQVSQYAVPFASLVDSQDSLQYLHFRIYSVKPQSARDSIELSLGSRVDSAFGENLSVIYSQAGQLMIAPTDPMANSFTAAQQRRVVRVVNSLGQVSADSISLRINFRRIPAFSLIDIADTVNQNHLVLRWTSVANNAIRYRVEYRLGDAGGEPFQSSGELSDTSWTLTNLQDFQWYEWRVTAYDVNRPADKAYAYPAGSSLRHVNGDLAENCGADFFVNYNQAPLVFTLLSPVSNAEIDPQNALDFVWHRAVDADSIAPYIDALTYRLILTYPLNNRTLIDTVISDTTLLFSADRVRQLLLLGEVYTWSVSVSDGNNATTQSQSSYVFHTTGIPFSAARILYPTNQDYSNQVHLPLVFMFSLDSACLANPNCGYSNYRHNIIIDGVNRLTDQILESEIDTIVMDATALNDGAHQLMIRTHADGYESIVRSSEAVTFVLDRQAPFIYYTGSHTAKYDFIQDPLVFKIKESNTGIDTASLELRIDGVSQPGVILQAGVSDTTIVRFANPSVFQYDHDYNLEVQIADRAGNRDSIGLSVSTIPAKPTRPVLLFPATNFQITSTADLLFHFEWQASQDPDSNIVQYEVYLNQALWNTIPNYSDSAVLHSSALFGLGNGTYQWYVKVIDTRGNADSSEVATFTVNIGELVNDFYFYPNPVDRVGIVSRFHLLLSEPAELNLRVMDLAGQIVAAPARDLSLPNGEQVIEWNLVDYLGRELANGVYIAELQAKQPAGKVEKKFYKIAVSR